ncbi:oligopeptide/dipeptide ABC transporter ATP-binding protein [Sedimentibacter acidaminivorans]|uniref:Oligopeptide/dipeptide ABC transporter ATP-binding protein n=1 Tax=Sedimentibacter acidaminivorans TaxID=913099 RepID=A0ABS4GDT5_9FIRM|nr:ABC transporter ATP-binding protein [Sedimentibacter acidaminivorans]MBP1925530.1 oligopeptide/dipeptide ABC transporter ATP-binding protein [Sedimentibacter acidaminivorans]
MNTEKEPLVQVKKLSKYFQISKKETLKAVEDVSFDIYKGETVGLVGESGCGKSTTGRCLVKLYEPTKGNVLYKGKDIFDSKKNSEKLEYCKNTQMIFQNPYSSLNPRMTVKDVVGEGIRLHEKISEKNLDEKIEDLLKTVGLNRDHMSRFSHEFSGGQRQRIGIARALSVNPEFIVCDEPISALDVSIQAQVLNMLKKLQKERGLTYLFIAHDLSVVKYISDKVIVMYLGTIVEQANAVDLYKNPMHPYTKALLSAIPEADPKIAKSKQRIMLKGEIPSPINPKECCRFVERCTYAKPICHEAIPKLKTYDDNHKVACHLF